MKCPNSSTGGAWLLGEITFNATDLTLEHRPDAGTLDITKSGPSSTTILTPKYTFGSANINVAPPPGRIGDINGDTFVNAADIDLMSAKLATGGLPYDVKYDYRSDAASPGPPPERAMDSFTRLTRIAWSAL